jgi:hypothetical protein
VAALEAVVAEGTKYSSFTPIDGNHLHALIFYRFMRILKVKRVWFPVTI